MYAFTRANTARALGYYPYFLPIEDTDATVVVLDGKKVVMLGSNNYLGLTNHPDVIEAGVKALRKYGAGLTGSRFLNGNTVLHEELESKLAAFVGKEAALVFSTGYGVNLGVIAATVGPGDTLFTDELNHASIVDGTRFSRTTVSRFRHNDMADLEARLAMAHVDKGRLIVTDGVFSMEGDIINLPEVIRLARQYGARVMVDDAHALGVLGPQGEGTAGHFGMTDETDLIMGTFSKSLSGLGGFIAGDHVVTDYLKHHARTMIFSASLPPATVATVIKALEILQNDPERRENLWENCRYMKTELEKMGFDTGTSESPIIPIIVGEDRRTFNMWRSLLEAGVYTNPVVSPAVPKGRSLLRTSYMATHTRDQLDFCLEQMRRIGRKFRLINS
ncbi:MAG: aminotransferase class I/II-fold pyridoxal phosphate-dependent enzyme [Candidatus Marinimicrobia bacterium]|nr:aminotransferase class I/II-fold pyridoxal phosphate-dependent enzyme [Candidatus Neomarinimicrobiota bacterium]MCF7840833.1 aminotransferase class I/II-fold pyridoxal phosphate-dependent enzyme [Candidatus Neomarinimicrobiota bacterium]MCF7901824.1 aminotransferase class I/II-fold pyridoxal phosphate-dependent enzyme [Candidatus Neomarinimicrobiota bacterium]